VPEEDHGAACDLLTHYLEVIRQKHPIVMYELVEEQRLADPAVQALTKRSFRFRGESPSFITH
jgi:hypothetical protein